MKTFHTYTNGRMEEKQGGVVSEYPLVLHVNGREIATLIASPHDLRFLVAGFLRLQGFVDSVADFHMLSVCEDFGVANVRIKGELPERLKPVLTSGCGTGITFNLSVENRIETHGNASLRITPHAVFRVMEELAAKAESYKSHGGVHSAAIGKPDGSLLFFAEDIGRHNTLDRIAGEAMLKGVDLAGTMLVTSGRVSTEMAAKAASLGVALIASRTSPTDMAIEMCERAGITLAGYVRGGKFNVYAHPDRISVGANLVFAKDSGRSQGSPLQQIPTRIPGVTGVILAGGASTRMGSNKALLPYQGGRFIEAIYRKMSGLFEEVILVTNSPDQYGFLPCRKVTDLVPGMGPLAGIHSGLCHSSNPRIFVTACDMPYLHDGLVRHLASGARDCDVILPESDRGVEPLHAVYGKGALEAIEEALHGGKRRIVSFFPQVRVQDVPPEEVARFDPAFQSFRNINTPEEYFRFREGDREAGSNKIMETDNEGRETCSVLECLN
ncbi:MAG: formate dehydrogenase accessory sulfurtransferase FdhD [Geobacter sp.]|nr:formate dehydrogenase accessory sulfurtransferase FdhD [Geobacter sp.]